ncbi:hypothetical protein ACSBR1_034915 [Camellia fascicularis]
MDLAIKSHKEKKGEERGEREGGGFGEGSDRTIVFKVVSKCTLKDLTDFLSCKLKKFDSSGCILLSGHSQCMIDDDTDFQNMLSLVYPLGVDRVDVIITEMGISNQKHKVRESEDTSGFNITDDEMDLLPMFCQHEERTLLSCGWVNGITHVGQRFIEGAKDFRTALCKYAIEIGFEFVYVKNEKCRVTAVCSMRESKAYLWRVHASLESANNFFYIRTLHDEHTCGAAVRTSKNSRMSSNLVASLIINEVRGNSQTRSIDVMRQFTDQYGLTITYNHTWLGVEKARTTTFGDFSMSYDEIRWYIDIVMSTNPETTDSWEWFFMHLSNILLDERPITFISDQNAGLLEALPKVLPTAYHYFCLQLLKANLRDRFSGPSFSNTFKSRIVFFLFSLCAYAPTVGCFN